MEGINEEVKDIVLLAIKEYEKSKVIKRKNKILYNTKLLLNHYNDLKNHADNAVYKQTVKYMGRLEAKEQNYTDDCYLIESIKESRVKTLMMIENIDMALKNVKRTQKVKGTEEKYEALELYYINKMKKDDIAEELSCSSKSVSRWIKELEEEVGINIFGINSIECMLV
ncbi:MAG: hypothetical protein ACRC68_04340 [Clostridium sp.]